MNKWLAGGFMVAVYFTIQGMVQLLRVSGEQADQQWIPLYEGHFWQMVLALILIGIFSGGRFSEWGLNVKNAQLSFRILGRFVIVYSLIILGWNVLPYVLSGRPPVFSYPLTFANVVGWLTFGGLFVGVSEEILFRGLIHTYLAKTWLGVWKLRRIEIPSAALIATLIFCMAHIGSVHINWAQQLFAFGLGMYYSIVYHRTGSLLNPILAHNYSDGIIYVALYSTYYWLR